MNTKKLIFALSLAALSGVQARGFGDLLEQVRHFTPEIQRKYTAVSFKERTVNVDTQKLLVSAPLIKFATTFFTAKENSTKVCADHAFNSFIKTFVSLAALHGAEKCAEQTATQHKFILNQLIPAVLRVLAAVNYTMGQTNTGYADVFHALKKRSLKDLVEDKSAANIARQIANVIVPILIPAPSSQLPAPSSQLTAHSSDSSGCTNSKLKLPVERPNSSNPASF
jgi:hypothetical protein